MEVWCASRSSVHKVKYMHSTYVSYLHVCMPPALCSWRLCMLLRCFWTRWMSLWPSNGAQMMLWSCAFMYLLLGVPTSKKNSSNLAGWWIFWTIFHEDFKKVNSINAGHTPLMLDFCPHSPHTGLATGCVGESLASSGFVWSKNQEGYFC